MPMIAQGRSQSDRCPICGIGVFTDLAYVERSDKAPGASEEDVTEQNTDSRELLVFSCGHEVVGAKLEEADLDRTTIERRGSDETSDASVAEERVTGSHRRLSRKAKRGR